MRLIGYDSISIAITKLSRHRYYFKKYPIYQVTDPTNAPCAQISRKPLELRIIPLWYLLITYSMICVILLYTYQFDQIRKLWTQDPDVLVT